MVQLSPILTVMTKAAEKAAKGLVRDFGEVEQLQVSRKGPRDFVSAADTRSEAILIEELRRARPDYGFLVEESGEIEGRDKEHRWVIDPLDGTGNFLHSIPHFCISIALEKTVGGKSDILAGLIYQPLTQEVYYAERNGGAYHNHRGLKVSSRKDLSDAILGTGNASLRSQEGSYHRLMENFSNAAYAVRSMGSAALDLAFVAAGKYDAFWQRGLQPWDIAAGILLVREAGGVVRDFHLKQDIFSKGEILASNSLLAPKLDKLMAEALRGQ